MDARLHDSPYSWVRLGLSLVVGVFGNVGMWAIIVMMPRCRPNSASTAPMPRCPTP